MENSGRHFPRYLNSLGVIALALGLRIFLVRWTGVGAPFLLFFGAVLASSFFWGVGPGLLATLLSTGIGGSLFIYQAHFTLPQTVFQCSLFFCEAFLMCILASRFGNAKRKSETDERIARKALAESRIFRAVLENSSDFIGIADENGKPVWINSAGRRMVGLAPDFPIETTKIQEYYPSEQRGFATDVIVKSMLERGYWNGETYFRNWKTEKAIPVSDTHFTVREPETGRILGMATITRDISELKRVEAELRERETELEEAQRVAHVGSWLRDANGDVVYWSDELYRVFGWDPKLHPPDLKQLSLVYTSESLAKVTPAIERILKEGIPYEMDLEVIHPDGTTRLISTRAEALRDASGRIKGFRGVAQDVTELRQLQKMREEWTSVIAHDLRQPIGVIKMNAEFLQRSRSCEADERSRVACDRIRSSASSLARMVDDLLDISQMEAQRLTLDRKWVDPRVIVREIAERLSPLTRDFRMTIDEHGSLDPVYVDPVRIEQVLGNLISNAAKYGEKGSEIHIQLNPHEESLEISVTNQGRGIPAEEIPMIFSRFSRSRSTQGSGIPGLGLGLYICKGLIDAHGGRIWVESIPGDTTTFHFTVPTRLVSAQKSA